jgi:hypothetical protein
MSTLCLKTLERKIDKFICDEKIKIVRHGPSPKLSLAKMAVLCIAKSHFGIESWKSFFSNPLIRAGWKKIGGFSLCSYGRFILRLPQVLPLLQSFLNKHLSLFCGIGAVDSTLISWGKEWCSNDKTKYKSLRQKGANAGHGSTGKYFGVKLHLVTTDQGCIHAFAISPASESDLTVIKKGLLANAIGIVLADSGYVSHFEYLRLLQNSLALWAKPRKNQEEQFSPVQKKLYRYREVAESVFAKLKQSYHLVPRWPPRRITTGFVHILSALIAYTLSENKPRMRWSFKDFAVTAPF